MQKTYMKVIIAGSRQGFMLQDVLDAVDRSNIPISEVVSGTARGVDKLGEEAARMHNCPVTRFPANWKKYGRSAGHIRNREMGNYADALIALWDGESPGTKGMIEYMQSLNKPVYVYRKE